MGLIYNQYFVVWYWYALLKCICVCVRMYVLPGVDGVLSVVCHTLVRDLWLASSWPPLQHETSVQLHIHTVSLYIINANKNGSFVLKGMTSDYLV